MSHVRRGTRPGLGGLRSMSGGWLGLGKGDPSDCMTTGLIQGQGKEKGSMGLNIS